MTESIKIHFSKQNSYVNQLFGQCMITSAANTVIPFIISASLRLASPLLCGEIKTCQPACRQATSQVSVIVFQFTLGAAGAELTLRKHPTSKSSLHWDLLPPYKTNIIIARGGWPLSSPSPKHTAPHIGNSIFFIKQTLWNMHIVFIPK